MPIEVGPPSQSAGPGGIPMKYLIIGAGALGVGALLYLSRGKGGTTATGDVQPTGSTSAQLSSVQQMQLSQFGELTKLFGAQSDLIQGQIGGLSAHLDTQAAALTSAITSGNLQEKQDAYNIMHGIYQAFRRATDPSWMPGGADDPWVEHSAITPPTTAVGST